MPTPANPQCRACADRGWVLTNKGIQRCDACEGFASDAEALRALDAARPMLEALRALVLWESNGDGPLNPNQRKALWDEARAAVALATV
jgi:hypothetical protein